MIAIIAFVVIACFIVKLWDVVDRIERTLYAHIYNLDDDNDRDGFMGDVRA